MKLFTFIFAAIAALVLSACQFTGTLQPAQVQKIQAACNADKLVRPTVNVLLVLATPAEVAGINAARGLIDQVCANPGGVQADQQALLTQATGQVACVAVQLQLRKEGKAADPLACVAVPIPVAPVAPVAVAPASAASK